MKLLRRDTDAALKALLLMAPSKGKRVDTANLSEKMGISRQFLRRILQDLQKKGFLKSSRGKGGGFWLELDPADIRILNVIEAFQGQVELQECLFQKKICPDIKTCALRQKILELEASLVDELKKLTLKDLSRISHPASLSALIDKRRFRP